MSEEKWTPGMWEVDVISASTDDFDYDSYAVIDEDGNIIVDALNSGVSSIEREGPDEEGHVDRWDEQARRNCTFIASAPALYDALQKLAAEVDGMRAFEEELRQVMSTTNWNVLRLRVDEAQAALAQARGETK